MRTMLAMDSRWPRLGGQLGLLGVAAGIIVISLGWNGAAGEFRVDAQMPYLLSGGALGLALVGLGVGLLVTQSARRDRAVLEAKFEELSRSVSRLANGMVDTAAGRAGGPGDVVDVVVAGTDSYHRPDCTLVTGKDLPRITVDTAAAENLEVCRVCNPPVAAAVARRSV